MVKLILDTDLGGDCDDAGALALLHNLLKQGKAECLAITTCSSAIYSATTIQYMNECFGRGNIPLGKNEAKPFLETANFHLYAEPLSEEYLENHGLPKIENAVRLLRRKLSENKNVTLVTIGMLNNIADLLRSEADDISPLNGIELVEKHVNALFAMGGNFEDLNHSEWNIACDVESARHVSENFPRPIVFSGFELGMKIYTGRRLGEKGKDNPFYKAYEIMCKAYKSDGVYRDSWDPITVYAAVETDTPYITKSEPLTVRFDEIGRVLMTDGGKDCYLKLCCSKDEMRDVLDDLMVL